MSVEFYRESPGKTQGLLIGQLLIGGLGVLGPMGGCCFSCQEYSSGYRNYMIYIEVDT